MTEKDFSVRLPVKSRDEFGRLSEGFNHMADHKDFALTIRDNGIGFDVATMRQKGESHVGINIMRERAQSIRAVFDIASVPGGGTTVVLHLPHEQRLAA